MKYGKQLKLTCTATAVMATLMGGGANALAQEADVTTETVKVTASRVEKELMDVNMSVSVITEEQIRHSSARNVGELLETIPGVRINNDGGQGMKRVKIRGEDAFRTLVMIDGQKIAEHKSMSGSPMLIDPSQIERIEVIKGPASVLYGSDAIGGAINIITKKGGDKPFGAEVSAGYNSSANGKDASAAIFGAVDGWKYRLSASIEDNDNLDTPVGEMPNTYFNARSLSGSLSYDINADTTVGASVDYYDLEFGSGDYGTPGFAVDVPEWTRFKTALFGEMKNVSDTLVRVRADAFYQRSEKEMVNTVPTMPWTPKSLANAMEKAEGQGYTEQQAQQMLSASGAVLGNTLYLQPHAENTIDQYGFSLQSDWQLGENNYLVAGYELNYDKLDAHSWSTTKNADPFYMGPMFARMTTDQNYDGYQMTNAVYASMETTLPSDILLTYGARYTWVKTEMDIYDNKNNGSKTTNDTSDGKVVFNAGILWRPTSNTSVRVSYAQGYRTPILQELYVDTSMGQAGGTTYSNENLEPETSDNFEIGARWNSDFVSADLTLFYSEADNYITTVYKTEKKAYQYDNVEEAKTFGAELSASMRISNTGFEPYASLTWMRRQFNEGDFSTYDTATPAIMARYGVRWTGEKAGLGLRADAYARSQTATKKRYADGEDDYEIGGYTTLNLMAGVSFGPKKQYSLDVGLYNIFDQGYRENLSIYEPGRYFTIKMNARW